MDNSIPGPNTPTPVDVPIDAPINVSGTGMIPDAPPIPRPQSKNNASAQDVFGVMGVGRDNRGKINAVAHQVWTSHQLFQLDKSYTDFTEEFIGPIREELEEKLRKLECGSVCKRCEPWLAEWLLSNKQKRRRRMKDNSERKATDS